MDTKEQIDDLVKEADYNPDIFSDWERQFIDSVADQFYDKGRISPKQEEIVERIWKKI